MPVHQQVSYIRRVTHLKGWKFLKKEAQCSADFRAMWLLAIMLIGTLTSVLVTVSSLVTRQVTPAFSNMILILSLYRSELSNGRSALLRYSIQRHHHSTDIFLDSLRRNILYCAVDDIPLLQVTGLDIPMFWIDHDIGSCLWRNALPSETLICKGTI